jgi:hypothetical protein
MAPAVAYLASEGVAWCRGQVIFSAGSELSAISPPRLLEAIRTDGVEDMDGVLGTVMPVVLSPAEAQQGTGGGSNPRFGDVFGRGAAAPPAGNARGSCVVVSDGAAPASAIVAALPAWGLQPIAASPALEFDAPSDHVLQAADSSAPLDALIVVSNADEPADKSGQPDWLRLLSAQASATRQIMSHASWLRAAARYAVQANRSIRVVHVSMVASDRGEPAAQAIAQVARSAGDSSVQPAVEAFSICVRSERDSDIRAAGHLAARLAGADDAPALRGAELVVGRGWLGLRSHPGPVASVSFGGPAVPPFLDDVLRQSFFRQY